MGLNCSVFKTMLMAGLVGVAAGCAGATDSANWQEEQAQRQDYLASINGLPAVNGLTLANGLGAVNGLTLENGLGAVNGLPTINGLAAVNGLPAVNGLSTENGLALVNGLPAVNGLAAVNGLTESDGSYYAKDGSLVDPNVTLPVSCADGQIPGKDCWGYAQGILNPQTGMLASDAGIMTAKYMIRCALPADRSLGLVDYTGNVIRLNGEIGFAPEWENNPCDSGCQEKVSACLMALTNSSGQHVNIELSAPFVVGTGHSASRCMNEAMFYGNLFTSPPNGFYALGTDADGIISSGGGGWDVGKIRCDGWGTGQCPYTNAGVAYHYYFAWTSDKCDAVNFGVGMIAAPCQGPGAAKACRGNARTFTYTTVSTPLTTTSVTSYVTTSVSTSKSVKSGCAGFCNTTYTYTSTVTVTPTVTSTLTTGYSYTTNTSTSTAEKTYTYPITTFVSSTGGM